MEAALTKGIGNTPLLRLDRISRDLPQQVQLLAKAEWMNPGGSVKDRPAASMILDGEKRGALRPGLTILDATSGNTGVAYAMIGASRGYRVKLCAPANTEEGILATLRAYGAELILTDPAQAMDGASREVARMMAASPESYFFPDQMNNDANWKAHYEGTAAEIWEQTRGQPASPLHGLEGLRHLQTTIVPRIYDPTLADETVSIETEAAQAMVVRLAREEGIFVRVSAGGRGCGRAGRCRAPGERRRRHRAAGGRTQIHSRAFLGGGMKVVVPSGILERMRRHGEETYPHECCGFMLGSAEDGTHRVVEIRSQTNERTESRENRFLITPDQFKAAESAARKAGLQLVGIYHSHPDSPAR